MKSTELRIGNFVYIPKTKQEAEISLITEANIVGVNKDVIGLGSLKIDELESIPLSDEWLWALGAEIDYRTYIYDRFKLIWKEAYKYWYVVDKENSTYLTKVDSVHEWQNFVYAMNGEELKLRTVIKKALEEK